MIKAFSRLDVRRNVLFFLHFFPFSLIIFFSWYLELALQELRDKKKDIVSITVDFCLECRDMSDTRYLSHFLIDGVCECI